MNIANARLKLDELGSDIPLVGVTPAEVMFLAMQHSANVKDIPIHAVGPVGTVERTALNEVKRLRAKYGKAKISDLFGKGVPQLPETFEEALETARESISAGDDAPASGPATFFGGAEDVDAIAKAKGVSLDAPGKSAVDDA